MIIQNTNTTNGNPYSVRQKQNVNISETFAIPAVSVTNSEVPKDEAPANYASHFDVFEQMTGQSVSSTSGDYDFDSHWTWYCTQLGIDNVSALNPDSKGDKELTEEQISALKEKYDVTNLTKEQEISLLTDLVDMGVLTREQALKSQMAKLYSDHPIMSVASERASAEQLTSNNLIERLTAMIKDEKYQYNRLLLEYGEKDSTLMEYANEHEYILDVISKLV